MDEKAIEAAAAVMFRQYCGGTLALMQDDIRQEWIEKARAVIAAYLADTGVERDKERLDFLINNRNYRLRPFKKNKWICASEFTNYEIDVFDDARAAIDSARGGEHG